MRRVVGPNTEVFTFTPVELDKSLGFQERMNLFNSHHHVIKESLICGQDVQNTPFISRGWFGGSNFGKLWITNFTLSEPQLDDIVLRFELNGTPIAEWSFDPSAPEFKVPIGDSKDTCSILLSYGNQATPYIRPLAHVNFFPKYLGGFCDKYIGFFWKGTDTRVQCSFNLRAEVLYFSQFILDILSDPTWTTFTIRSNLGTKRILSDRCGVIRVPVESPRGIREKLQNYTPTYKSYMRDGRPELSRENFQNVRETCKLIPSRTCLKSSM